MQEPGAGEPTVVSYIKAQVLHEGRYQDGEIINKGDRIDVLLKDPQVKDKSPERLVLTERNYWIQLENKKGESIPDLNDLSKETVKPTTREVKQADLLKRREVVVSIRSNAVCKYR